MNKRISCRTFSSTRAGTSVVVALLASCFIPASFAASNYSQNFTSGAPSWAAASGTSGTWSASSGYYSNVFESTNPAMVAVYTGDTWATGFTYSLKMFSDYNGTGNRVGAVFNYVDVSNYYAVQINMSGQVYLYQVSGGTFSLLSQGQVSTTAVPGNDQWFTVTITRSGNSVTIGVGGETAISNLPLPSSPQGRIGFITRYNHGRYDDVNVALAETPPLFRSGFESGVTLTSPECIGPAGDPSAQVYFQNLTGQDNPLGAWPPTFYTTPSPSRIFNTGLSCNNAFATYMDHTLKNVTGPTGTTTRVLSNTIKDVEAPDGDIPRLGVSYAWADTYTPSNTYYIRRYLKYPSNLLTSMGTHDWFVQHEYKTRDCTGTPRRLILYWHSNGSSVPYYRLMMDQATNCGIPNEFTPIWEMTCYPSLGQNCPAFPVGQWFYDEFFVRYSASGSSQDRVAYAINGQIVFDRQQPMPSNVHRGIKMTPGYLNIPNMEVQVDDVEVHAAPPCGTFPCGPPQHQ